MAARFGRMPKKSCFADTSDADSSNFKNCQTNNMDSFLFTSRTVKALGVVSILAFLHLKKCIIEDFVQSK